MFTKNNISVLVRGILFITVITGLLGLHPAATVLAARQSSGDSVGTLQNSIALSEDLPDLIIESITLEPADPEINEDITFMVVVTNQGLVDTDRFYVDLYIDDTLPTECLVQGWPYFDVPGVAAGASEIVEIPYTGFAIDGLHTIHARVDTDCQVNESDETNNFWTGTMDWVAPTITFNSVFTASDLGTAGSPDNATSTDPLLSGSPTTTFNAGDPIELYLNLSDGIARDRTVAGEWQVTGPNGEVVPELSIDETHIFPSASDWWWWIDTTVPTYVARGTYTFVGEVTYNGVTTTKSTTFAVEGSPAVEAYDAFVTGGDVASTEPQLSSDPDPESNSISTVTPGDDIQLYIDTYNDVAENEPASFEWRLIDPDGNDVTGLAWSGTLNSSLGHSWWYLPVTIPADAVAGDYTFVGAVTYAGHTTHSKATLYVDDPTPPPSSVPGAFNKLSPANVSIKQPVTATLSWTSSAEAAEYEYCYDTSNNGTCDSTWVEVSSTSASLSGLAHNTIYYWQVRAVNSLGTTNADGSSTAFWNFKTVIAPPTTSAPGGTDLNDPTAEFTRRPLFQWQAVAGASNYRLQVVTAPYCSSFATRVLNLNVSGTSYTPTADLPTNTQFCWRVRANGTNGPSAWSAVRSFTTGSIPTVPVQVTPANTSLVTDFTPLLDWGNSTVAGGTVAYYRIWVDNNSGFSSPEVNTTVTASKYVPPTHLAHNTKHFWKVQAVHVVAGNEYASAWSPRWYFRTVVDAPSLLVPVNDFRSPSRRPLFDWNAPSGTGAISGYVIQISKNNTFTQIIKNASVVDSAYTPTTNLPKGIQLYWRVQTTGANGPSAWTATRYFSVANPPSTPTLTAPISNALLTTSTPLLQWTAVTVPTGTTFQHYQVQVDDTADFSSLLTDDTSITSPSVVQLQLLSALSQNTQFFWRVRAVNTVGDVGNWSVVGSFRTIIQSPSGLSATLNGLQPSFDWDDATGPGTIDNYTIQVSTAADFSSLLINSTTNMSDYSMLTDLPAGSTIHWRVLVNGANGPSAWSTAQFNTP